MNGNYLPTYMRGAYKLDALPDERLQALLAHLLACRGHGSNALNTRDSEALLDATHQVLIERASPTV